MLLDKDGTLLDFRATWLPRYRAAAEDLAAGAQGLTGDALLARLGHDPAGGGFEEGSPLLWDTNAAIADRWAAMPELAGRADAREAVLRHLADHDRHPPVAVGDVRGLLARLRGAGLRLGLATMDDAASADDTVRRLGLAKLLDFLAGADSGHGTKPGPGMALAFCAALGLAPAEVAVVGDTTADLMMARAAGCGLAVGVRTGATPPGELKALADRVLDDVHGLPGLILGG